MPSSKLGKGLPKCVYIILTIVSVVHERASEGSSCNSNYSAAPLRARNRITTPPLWA